jgi:hypothetical protein
LVLDQLYDARIHTWRRLLDFKCDWLSLTLIMNEKNVEYIREVTCILNDLKFRVEMKCLSYEPGTLLTDYFFRVSSNPPTILLYAKTKRRPT